MVWQRTDATKHSRDVGDQVTDAADAGAPPADHPGRSAVGVVVVLDPGDSGGHGEELADRHVRVSAAGQLGHVLPDPHIEIGQASVRHGDAGHQRQR